MAIELTLLGYTLVLALIYLMAAAQARTSQYGAAWNAGARDEVMPPLKPVPARLVRAQANLMETLPLFAAAVLAVVVAGRTGPLSEVGAWTISRSTPWACRWCARWCGWSPASG